MPNSTEPRSVPYPNAKKEDHPLYYIEEKMKSEEEDTMKLTITGISDPTNVDTSRAILKADEPAFYMEKDTSHYYFCVGRIKGIKFPISKEKPSLKVSCDTIIKYKIPKLCGKFSHCDIIKGDDLYVIEDKNVHIPFDELMSPDDIKEKVISKIERTITSYNNKKKELDEEKNKMKEALKYFMNIAND